MKWQKKNPNNTKTLVKDLILFLLWQHLQSAAVNSRTPKCANNKLQNLTCHNNKLHYCCPVIKYPTMYSRVLPAAATSEQVQNIILCGLLQKNNKVNTCSLHKLSNLWVCLCRSGGDWMEWFKCIRSPQVGWSATVIKGVELYLLERSCNRRATGSI